MDNLVVECKGAVLENFFIPPFLLKVGEYASLNFPGHYNSDEELKISSFFTGDKKNDKISIYKNIVKVSEPSYHKVLLKELIRIPYNSTVRQFLAKNTTYTDEELLFIINRLKVKPQDKLLSLGANTKKMLALEVAFSRSPNILLNTLGLDPIGIELLFERLEEHLLMGSVIEINYEDSKGRTQFKSSNIINVIDSESR